MAEKNITCRVVSNKKMTPTVYELKFRPDRRFHYKAGQFLSIVIPGAGPGGRGLRRAYSIASPPEFENLELCIKLVEGGPGTNFLCRLEVGQSIQCDAPYGDFIYKTSPTRTPCFIATGTGLAPFRAIMLSNDFKHNAPKSAICLHGVREDDELLYTAELQTVPQLQFIQAVTKPKVPTFSGFVGRVTDYLRQNVSQLAWQQMDFYLCGNGAMIDEVKSILAAHQVAKGQIHQEVYYKPKAGAAPV